MNEDLIDLFLEESRDLVVRAQADLDALDTKLNDAALLDSLFRAIHTLKGSVAIFDWTFFAQMLHAAEDLLSAARGGEKTLNAESISALGACMDKTESWLAILEAERAIPSDGPLQAAPLTRALRQALRADEEPAATQDAERVAPALMARAQNRGAQLSAPLFWVSYTPGSQSFFAGQDPVAIASRAPGLIEIDISAREPWADLDDYDPFACNLRIDLLCNASREALEAAFDAVSGRVTIVAAQAPDHKAQPAGPTETHAGDRRTMRVDVEKVDALAHTVDELVVAKNALLQLALENAPGSAEDLSKSIRDHQATIGRLTARMHAAVTAMRLVPIGPTMGRLPRIARDLGARLDKPVDVILECEEIEADKAVVDGLSEPLLHLVRNALDHGVEPADQRRAAGKPERARITISARRSGENVSISVADDGPGIDPSRIRQIARERHLLPSQELDALDDRHVVDLIFRPGFSTAAQVSEISGRGVGMDAVRSAVGQLGGRTEVASTPGAGTTISLTLPLSMVLTQIAVIACDGESYGVPMHDILELARVDSREISDVRHGKAFFLRDRAVPIVSLERLLGRPEPAGDSNVRVLVLRAGNEWIGVTVPRLLQRIEAVVSPAGGLLTGMKGFAGTTIMGDGSVLIVLDLPELIG